MKQLIMMVLCALVLAACSSDEESNEQQRNDSNQQESVNEAVEFRNIDVKIGEDAIKVTGEAQSKDGVFYYKFEQGETVLAEENKVDIDKDPAGWSDFQIEVALTKAVEETKKVPLITLYSKNEDNEMINQNYIPIDLIKQQKQE